MLHPPTSASTSTRRSRTGCVVASITAVVLVLLVLIGGALFIRSVLTGFDRYRDRIGVRSDLEVVDANLRFSPGFDAVIYSRFTVEADGIDAVFDPARVDTSEFDEPGYTLGANWITAPWWDANARALVGGETGLGGDYLRVGYVDNGDGTLTVYVFFFEV